MRQFAQVDAQTEVETRARQGADRLARQLRNLASPADIITNIATSTQPKSIDRDEPFDLDLQGRGRHRPGGNPQRRERAARPLLPADDRRGAGQLARRRRRPTVSCGCSPRRGRPPPRPRRRPTRAARARAGRRAGRRRSPRQRRGGPAAVPVLGRCRRRERHHGRGPRAHRAGQHVAPRRHRSGARRRRGRADDVGDPPQPEPCPGGRVQLHAAESRHMLDPAERLGVRGSGEQAARLRMVDRRRQADGDGRGGPEGGAQGHALVQLKVYDRARLVGASPVENQTC